MRKTKRRNDNCLHCGRSKRFEPCEHNDHQRLCLNVAMDAAAEPVKSFGCENPLERQAKVLPTANMRRHPVADDEGRPENSGWCPDPNCDCECHSWEEAVIDYIDLEV